MVLKKLKTSDLSDLDTKERIMEAAVNLFALKGFDGASIRDIAKLANVNVASLNYHFKSKENLRQEIMTYILNDFRSKINNLANSKNTKEYALKIFESLTADSAKCLNQFKLILESDFHPCVADPYPAGYQQFFAFLEVELNKKVPMHERVCFVNVLFSYIVHTAVMSSTKMGKMGIDKMFPGKQTTAILVHISTLVDTFMRDLNSRYK